MYSFARVLRKMGKRVGKDEKGFTLIELLVVVIIIGILAAIAIPVFLNQREQAWESAAQSNLRNATSAATACSADNDGSFSDCGAESALGGYGYNQDSNVNLSPSSTSGEWSATAVHTSGGATFTFNTNDGQVREQGGGDD